jgi:hypothetical protein
VDTYALGYFYNHSGSVKGMKRDTEINKEEYGWTAPYQKESQVVGFV